MPQLLPSSRHAKQLAVCLAQGDVRSYSIARRFLADFRLGQVGRRALQTQRASRVNPLRREMLRVQTREARRVQAEPLTLPAGFLRRLFSRQPQLTYRPRRAKQSPIAFGIVQPKRTKLVYWSTPDRSSWRYGVI
jgi:hypothetical protein